MQSYNRFYFVVNMHLIWFSSWVFTLALAGDCAAQSQSSASQTNLPFSLKNILPKIKLYTYADAESESELKYIKDSIPLGQDWRNQEISDLSLPTHWTKVVFECESRYSAVKWEVPDKAKLSGVQTESIRQQHGYSEPLVYLHKSYLILSNITDRLTGDYKCRAIQQQTSSRQLKNQENQGKTNSFYLFVPNGGDRLAKANDDNNRQEATLYVATPFSINIADDKSLVSYKSSTTQFQFFSRKGRVEVASTPHDDKEGIIKVISPKGTVKTWKFIIIDQDLYEAKGFRQEECEINAEMDQDCDFKSFKCQSATVRPPKIHFTPLNAQGCPVKNRRRTENVIITSCGIGCTKLMTSEQRGIVKCVGDGVEENNSDIRFPFDLYCSQSPYLIDRGNVIRVGSADNSSIIIPCTANHPQAPITLGKQHRVAPGMIDWQDKPVGFDGVEYDPKQGFLIDNNTTDIFGTYLCVSDRTLVDWRDHMVVHVDSSDGAREFEATNSAEDSNSKERTENEEEDDDDESDIPVLDEELYLKQNSLRPDIIDPIGESKIPDLEYEIGKQYQFLCYGSRDVYSWGMFWSVETEDGETFTVDDSFAMSESAITTALSANTSGIRNVYSQVTLTFPVKEIKTLWCNAPVLNSPFEWRKVSWPVIIADKEDRNCAKNGQTMRVSHLGAPADTVYELTRDNHITSRRRSYRHYVVPDGSTSLGVISNAAQPLTWSHEGITSPQPGISVSSFRSAPNFQDTDTYCFASELRFDNLTIEHTGQYIVSYATEPERHMSFYLFVSSTKPPFFLKSTGNRVPWNKDESVRLIIPCLVNSPNLRASLYKQSPHGLKEVTSSFTYDPRRGFTSKFSVLSQEEALGEYVCLARSPSTYSIDKTVVYVYDTQTESQKKQMVHNLGPVDLNEENLSEEVEDDNVQINGTFKEGSTTIRNNTESHIIREVTIECSVSKPYASHGILWALRLQNDTLEFIEPLENGTVEFLNKENPNIITSRLKGHVSNTTENKAVECFVPVAGNSEWISHSFPISVFLQ